MSDAVGCRSWRQALNGVLGEDRAAPVAEVVAARWGGARIYLPLRVARLRWRCGFPVGAAELFAAELSTAIVHRGGTDDEARTILLALAQRHFVI